MITSILLSGVGGQGILLAEKIIASAAELAGYDVCANEVHGMAQRGGSVVAQIRYGHGVCSPLILEGTADALFSLEISESVRNAHYLKKNGFAAVSTQRIVPITVTTGIATYPDDIEDRVRKVFPYLKLVDCVGISKEMGDVRLANTLLLGVLSQSLPDISESIWLNAVEMCVKPAFVESNQKTFMKGRGL